jgi:glycosyltransferase involved in cell wall biosynthesis
VCRPHRPGGRGSGPPARPAAGQHRGRHFAPWLGRVRLPAPLAAILHQPPGGIDAAPWRVRLQARLDIRAYRPARLLAVASAALADDVRGHLLAGQPLVVVEPGRDSEADAGAPAAGSPQDLRRGPRAALLCVGNWVERKGALDLLDAVARLPWDAATLHLVGDPAADSRYAARVRVRLAQPDPAGRVVAHGAVPAAALTRFYVAADVFVLAGRREPYGTVYGEAMAAGLPVVGWAAGNLPNLARDGCEGLVVPPGSHAALSAALQRLCLDEALRCRLGAAARRRALTFPTWRESAARLFTCLRAAAHV